jgi:hypothetical protein
MFTSKKGLAKLCKFISDNSHLEYMAMCDTSQPYCGSLYDALHVLIRKYNQGHTHSDQNKYVYYVDCNEIKSLYVEAVKKYRGKNACK